MTDRVTVTTTYYRDESGQARIRVTAGHSVLYDQPNCYFFVDTERMKPWFEIFGTEKGLVVQ